MSADFWAGYISGAIGIVIGNPLDVIKVRLQAGSRTTAPASIQASTAAAWTTGTAAPILGYGALNALLFVSYNRSEAALNDALSTKNSLITTWLAGAFGGLATWVISAPTEVIKCRAQASATPLSSSSVARSIVRENGIRGLYLGGSVTAIRDSVGYGFYFWAYQLATSLWPSPPEGEPFSLRYEASKNLLCGGIAGIATWASVFPLDMIKTRIQTQAMEMQPENAPLLSRTKPQGAWALTKEVYRQHGIRIFFRGLGVCCARAFLVNAVQWAAYEAIMRELSPPQPSAEPT